MHPGKTADSIEQEEEINTLRTAWSRRSSPDCGRHRAAKEELTSSIENEEEQINKVVKIPETSQAPGYVRRLDTSKKQQLNENGKEIQIIKDKVANIDYDSNGDSGANAASGSSSDRADIEAGATSTNAEHSTSPERPVGEPIARSRDRGRGAEKCTPKTRTTVEFRPRGW